MRKRDRRARELKLRHENATRSTDMSSSRPFCLFVVLDACACLALMFVPKMTLNLRRSSRKVARFWARKRSQIILMLQGNFPKNILFQFLIFGFAIAFLVKLSLVNACAARCKRVMRCRAEFESASVTACDIFFANPWFLGPSTRIRSATSTTFTIPE